MMIHEITAAVGHRKRRRRVGRGESSGLGKTCGRGNKGCKSRSGGGTRPLHEGGQMPIFRRIPKRGFSNFAFTTVYETVNLSDLEARFDAGASVNAEALKSAGLISRSAEQVKLLGKGALTKKLAVTVDAISGSAREAIEKAGGSVEVVAQRDRAALAKAKRRSAKNRPAAARPSRLEKKKSGRAGAAR